MRKLPRSVRGWLWPRTSNQGAVETTSQVNALNLIFYLVSAIPFVALPFLLVNWVKYMKVRSANRSRIDPLPAKIPIKSVIFFAAPILVAIAVAEIVSSRSRTEVLSFLRDLSGNYKVYVNSKPARDPDRVVAALKEVAPSAIGHHSHPTKMIRVDIQGETNSLTLELGRDSGSPQEYWVFNPRYRLTSNNEIGRVTTTAFDDY